ncbi:hypothetical protein SUGI_0119550, partial [Cryptomeria japonica]
MKLPRHKPSPIHPDPFTKLYPSRCRVAQIPINMALITTNEQCITLHIGNHHPSLDLMT